VVFEHVLVVIIYEYWPETT